MKTTTGRVWTAVGRKGYVVTLRSIGARLLRPSLMLGVLCASILGGQAASLVQEFFLPMPEQQIYTADSSIETGVGTTFDSTFSVVVTGNGTVVYYDQWEDGYETDLANPTQSSTLIWGDGNNANGICPGFTNDPSGLAAGTVITLRNNVPLPRNPSAILYDARDRVGATRALVIGRAAWPTAQGSVFAGSASVYSTIDYGTNFVCPVGQDITNRLFGYVGMFVMAGSDNTSVTIDPDGPGTNTATTVTLNKGESYLVNGNVRKGATITSTKGVQAHAIIGHVAGRYASDWFNLTPVADWDDTYYTPVPTSASGNPAYVYLYNTSTGAITINYTTRTGSGSFSIPATNVFQFTMPQASGAKFVSSGGQRYFAICTVAANNSSDTAYNWGFTLVPKAALTTELVVGWGPGSSDGTANGSPAWVTPTANTTVYVDYAGDRVGPFSISGQAYDTNFTVAALQSQKIFDPTDKDQTGMRIFTVDGTLITGAWGEDADTAAAGNPYIDAGTTILPFPVPVLFKSVTNFTDLPPTGLSTNDVLQYTVQLDNRGLLPLGNTVVIDAPSTNLQYVTNSTRLNGSLIPDNAGPYTSSNTAFPLDAYGSQGYTIPIILRDGTSIFTYQVKVIAPGSVSNSVNVAGTTLSAQTTVASSSPTPTSCALSFTDSGGTAQSSYTVGGSGVYVTLTDNDENTATNSIQTASVVVRNVARNDLETITLTETGTNTGIFRNVSALPISTSTGLSQGDGTLYVVAGDTLTVTNFDLSNGDTCNSTATVLAPASGKVLYLSNPGQGLDRVDPVATADGTTATSTDIGSASGGSGTPGLASVTTTNTTANVAALNLNSVAGIGTTNRMLLVAMAFNPNGASGCTNVTFGPQTMSRVSTNVNGTQARTELWYLLNPTNITTNVVVRFSAAQSDITIAAMFFTNVNQTTTFTATNGVTGSTAGITNIITSSTTNTVVNVVAQRTSTGLTNVGPTMTTRWTFTATDPACSGSTAPGAASVTNSWLGSGGSAQWSSLAVSVNSAPGGGGGSGPATNATTFVQSPSFCLPFTIRSNSTIAITNYIALTNGSFGAAPAVSATLRVGSSNILTVASAAYNSTNNTLVWQGSLSTNFTVASGSAVSYVISNGVAGTAFHVNYDSSNAPSKIVLPTTTIINIDSLAIYDAPYPSGSLVTTPTAGTTYYVRADVSDPFGSSDITSLGVVVDGPGTSGDASVTLTNAVNDTGCVKTFEYTWTTINNPGSYTFTCTANEGTEGITNTAAITTTLIVLDLGTPSTATFTFGDNGTATNAYSVTSNVCVRISDLDQNLTNSVAENVFVLISSSAGDSQALVLTETTTNSGIFTGCLSTTNVVSGITNPSVLYAPTGSVLTVTYTDPTDSSDTSSDTATILTAPGVAGMAVTKSVVTPASGPVSVGSQITFNLLVQNTGSTILTNVTVRDNYPSNAVSYSSASLAPTSTNLGVLTWTNLGNLAVGGSTNFTVTFNATNAAAATNVLTGTSTATTNTSSVAFTVSRSLVTVTKTLVTPTNGPVSITSNITFRITVANTGSTTLTNIPLADTYSASIYTNVSTTRPVDGSGAGSLLWTNVGPLASNASTTIDVTLKVIGAANPANNTATADFVTDQFGNSVPPSTSSTGLVTLAASINGKVYNDIDQSATLTTNDTTLSGVTLSLYTDPNADGDPADGTLVRLVTSDSTGYYELLNLTTGRYVVVETDLAGYASTAPVNNRLPLNLTNLVAYTNNNFFDYQPNSTNYASFSGFVWNDLNGNGTNDVTEVGVSNVVVDLVQDVNTNGLADVGEPVINSTTTATNGSFSFTGVIPGAYVLRETDPSGYYSTADSVGANDNYIGRVVAAAASSTNNSFYDHFNLAPVAVNDTNSTTVNVAITLDPRVNDSDPDPTNTLTVISVSATNGVAVINGGTNVTFTPSLDFNGLATIGYTISDGHGGTASAIIFITVTAQADVSITKSGNTTVTSGQNLTYTIVVTNAGPSIATNVITRDTLPTNAIFVSASGGGTTNAGIVTWPTIASLASGGSTNFTVVVTAPANGSTLTNTASVTNSTPEPTLTNNTTPPVITTVTPSADVSVSKSAAGSVTAGQNLTYTVTITNAGPSIASNSIASDPLPAGVTFVSATGGGTTNAGVVSWPATNLASGSSSTYTLIVTAPTTGVTLTNFASVTNAIPDPTPTNNTTPPVVTTVNPSADVSITKSGSSSVIAGSSLTYTITVTNAGPSTATNVIASDPLPAGTAFSSASNGGTTNAGVVSWPATNLASSTALSYTLTVIVPTTGATLTNTASVTNSTPEPTLTNNVTPPVITTVTASADVSITKSGNASVTAGQNLTYTIVVTNAGPSIATNVITRDTLPATGTFVSASSGGTTNAGIVTWPTLATLAAGASTNYTVTLTAPPTGSLTNTANVTNSTPEPTLTNNLTPPVITTVGASADVSISKSAAGSVTAGQNLTYTITVTNAGPSVATNVITTDPLPAGVTFVSATSGGTTNAGVVTWPTLATLASGASTNYTLIVTAPAFGTTLTNFASVTNSTPDPTPTNTTPPVVTVVNPQADISITKSAATNVTAGQNLTYTITITNAGPSVATNAIASDTLPASVTFVSASGGGTTNAGVVTWPATNLASGSSSTYTLIVIAPTFGTTLTNFASITNSTPDPTPTNTTPPVVTVVNPSADVSITKSGSGTVTAGQSLTYTIVVTNAGPSIATNVIASDTLPVNGTFVSASGGGTTNAGIVTWPGIATLAAGASTNYTVTITAPPTGSLTNTAAVTNSTPEPTYTNNVTPPVITTVGASADVSVSKSAAGSVTAGQNLTYTITVTNAGPSVATNVVASDALPAGVLFVSASGGGTSNSGAVTWPAIPTLASGGSSNFTLIVTAPTFGTTLTNFASVTNSTPDPNPTNTTPPVVTTVNPQADVSVSKSAAGSVTAGQNLTYTVTITNAGPSVATNAVASDPLPVGVTFVSASGGGTTNAGVVSWPATNLASGSSSTYTLIVTAPSIGATLTNFASVTNNTPDPTPTNTTPPVVTVVNPSADVSITKSGAATVVAAQNLTYTIVVTNAGPSPATNVVATDTLPVNGTFVSASGGGTTNAGIVTWSLGTLASGTSTSLTVVVTAPASGSLTNTAAVTNSTPEPTLTNNVTPPVLTTVSESADISISKSAAASVNAGQNLTYTITVTNAGPSTATNVVASDALPAGVTFVSATGGGTNSSGTVTWPSTTLTNGASASYTLIVTAPTTGVTLTNFATVTTPTPDPTPTNTTPPVVTVVNPLADVSVAKSGAASVTAGQNLTYTITVTNAGPSTATNVVASDTLPAGVTFFSATGGGTNNSGTVTWPGVDLTNGATASYTLVVTAPAFGASLTNFAAVTNSTPDPTPTNNLTPPVVTLVNPSADVSVTKSGVPTVTAGQNLTYTITITNAGPSVATNAVASDALPAGATFVSASAGGTTNAGVVSWPATNLASGVSATYTLVVKAPPTGSLTNVAAVTNSTPEPTYTNNVTPPVITVIGESADVSVVKTGPAAVSLGTNFSYTIAVSNAGPSTAASVTVTDSVPAGLVFVSAFPAASSTNSGVIIWSLGNLAADAFTNLTLTVSPTTRTTVTNFATGGSPTSDPNPTNNVGGPVETSITNRPPVANPDSTNTVKNTTVVINPLPNDTDPDGDTLTITNVVYTNGVVTFTGTNVTYTPSSNFTGSAVITYVITDGNGGSATNVITVSVANQPPTAVNDSYSTPKNVAITVDPRTNDSDPDNDPLTIVSASPTNGVVVINGGTNLTFTPDTNFLGIATIGYVISDGGSTTNALITVLVTNRSPLAVGDVYSTPKNMPVTFDPRTNDSDPDGDPLTITSVTGTNGTAIILGGTNVLFTPATNFIGSVSLPYCITDGFGATNCATILISVTNRPPAAVDDSYSTPKNVPITVNPRSNDTDPDNDPLTIVSVTATNGTATIVGGTNVLFTPATNFIGTVNVPYCVTDGFGDTNCALMTFTTTNRPPTANPDSTNTVKNVPVVINPLPNDTDPDGDPLTITNAVISTNGVVTFTGTNVTFAPDTNFTGTVIITYTITDGFGGSTNGTITVNVANQPPTAVNDSYSTPKNVVITVDPRTNDSDPDNDPLTITSVSPTNGVAVINGGTNVTFTPDTNFLGIATIGYTISDGASTTNALITISITNRPPTAVNDSTNTVKNVPVVIFPLGNDTDPDGDTLTITNAVATNGVVVFTGTNITFTPSTNFVGTGTVTYTVTDGFGGSSTATVSIVVSNQPPVAVDDSYSTPKNVPVTVDPRTNDNDPDNDPLTITSVSPTNGVAVILGGTNILFTPTTNFIGTATIGYTITDGLAATNALITISITNRPPVANPDTTNTVKNVAVVINPLPNDTDPDGDTLTITNAASTNGVVVFTGTNVTFTPNTNFTGAATITYIITDGFGGSATNTITVNVANQPPIAVNDSYSTPKNVAITVDPRTNDSDPDNDPLTINSVTSTNGTATILGGTNVLYTPATNFIGTVFLPYTVSDGTTTSNALIAISITNRPPTAVNDSYSTPKSVALTVDPRTNDTDPDGDVLTIVSVTTTNGSVVNQGGTNILFTPATNFIGTATLPYCVTDGFGATNCAVITVSVTNRPPTAVNDNYSTPKNVAITVNPRSNDTDPDNDPLTIVSVSTTNGTASIVGGTNVLFTPATNFIGTVNLPYCITDGFGATNCAVITVSVTNRPPAAVDDSYGTPKSVAVTLTPRSNDTDPDGDPLTIVSVSTTNGTVSIVGGTNVLFTPATNFTGTASLPYCITDGFGATNCATITVSITNRPPTAVNDGTNTVPNVPVTVRPLLNDTDPDNDPLTIISVSPTNGTATIIGGTNVLFTPTTNFQGTATIGYTIIDGFGGTNSAVITVSVSGHPPVAVNDTNSTPRNVAVTIRPLTNDSDVDLDPLTITSVSPTNGTASIIGGTNVLFTPATNFQGTATIGYVISDGFYTTNATIFVLVTNRPPVAVNDLSTGFAFVQKTVSVLTNDSDPDGDTLILVSVTTTNGTASVSGNNVLFTPNKTGGNNYAVYTISDGHGGTNTALVIISVNNAAPTAVNDTYSIPRNNPYTFNPRSNDTDPNGDPLTITSVTATNGTAVINGGTNVTYTPVSNFVGTVYLPYTITDGAASSSALITINITNRPPVAVNDTNNFTTAGTPVTVRPLLNDSDPDNDPLTVISVTPTNGTASIVGGTNVLFTPSSNFTGVATIGYKITDGKGGTNGAIIYVNVSPATQASADVAVLMTGPTNVIAGNGITYFIVVTNMGPDPSTNVVLVDTLPPGTYYVSTSPTGTVASGQVTWPAIPVLPPGGSTNFTLTLYTTNLGYITNVAYASAVTPDPDLVNNNGSLPASQARTLVNPFAYTYGATNVFNPQTGLYEESVTVTNTGGTAVAAMRVYATGLPGTVILQNSIGTNATGPYVQYNGGLAPGESVTFLLEFLSTDRRPFTNGIVIEGTLPYYGSTNNGTYVTNITIFSETYPGTLTPHQVVEFATIPGRTYTILYSDDAMATWQVATPTIKATANVVQWIDSGPPKTITKPDNRFYQIIQSP